METRALAIAFFYAIGTAAAGISGPLQFANLIKTGKVGDTAHAFAIGATLMIAAGLVAAVLGVKAEQKSLEDIATPLTAEEADEEAGDETKASGHESGRTGPTPTPAGSDRRG